MKATFKATLLFQLVSKNKDGRIIARFTEPCISYTWAAEVQDKLGGYDPNGNPLEIILVPMFL